MEPLSVLLVDDDPELGTMMRLMLSREAPQILFHFAEGSGKCLEYLKENEVDCILSDYQMPGMDGLQLMHTIKEQGTDVPFILLTGQGNEEVARDALKNGANDYFTKEAGLAHFARIVNSVEQAVSKKKAELAKRKTAVSLLNEKNKLEAILANIGEGIVIVDMDFKVLYQNKAHVGIIGPHIGEYCYKAFEHKEEVCDGCPVAESLTDGLPHSVMRSTETERGMIYTDITSSPLIDADGDIVGGIEVVRDITEKKLAEDCFTREKEFADAVINCLPGVFYVYDDRWRLVRWNKTYLDVLGLSPEALLEAKALDAVAEEDREMAASKIRNVIVEHKDESAELTIVDVSGKRTPLYCTGVPLAVEGRTYLVGVGIDITERKKAEEKILHDRGMLQTLINSANFGMMVVGPDKTIRMANTAALRMMGYADESEIVGRQCHNVICPAEAGRCPVLDLGMRLDFSERMLLDRQGRDIPILKSVSPVMLGGEKVLLETFVDITHVRPTLGPIDRAKV